MSSLYVTGRDAAGCGQTPQPGYGRSEWSNL